MRITQQSQDLEFYALMIIVELRIKLMELKDMKVKVLENKGLQKI